MPTADQLCPDKVRMAKSCKYRIAQTADLGDGTGEYDMMQDDNRADDEPKEGILLDDQGILAPNFAKTNMVPVPHPLVDCTSNRSLSPRKSKVHEK